MQIVGKLIAAAWFLTCAVGGAILLNLAFDRAPQAAATYFPLIIAVWVAVGFLGRATLEKVFTILYRQQVKQATTVDWIYWGPDKRQRSMGSSARIVVSEESLGAGSEFRPLTGQPADSGTSSHLEIKFSA